MPRSDRSRSRRRRSATSADMTTSALQAYSFSPSSPHHCENGSDEAIRSCKCGPGLLRFARNDDLAGVNVPSHLDRGDIDPAPLAPALQRAFGELHALGAFQQRELVRRILADVADEHLPLLFETIVVADILRQLLPVAIEIVHPFLVRIPHR